jgi:hypothetical protein
VVSGSDVPRQRFQRLSALSFGSTFAAIAALVWVGFFSSVTRGPAVLPLVILPVVVGLFALGQGLVLRRTRPVQKADLPYLCSGLFWLKFYSVVALEVLLTGVLLRVLHHVPNMLSPVIALVVGAHFYPLAYWMGNRVWCYTASAIGLTNLALVVAVPPAATTDAFGVVGASVWTAVSTVSVVVVMLVTSLASAVLYRKEVPARKKS